MPCEWHQMRAAVVLAVDGALHLGGRDRPQRGVSVDFRPLHRPQVARTLERQRRQRQRAKGQRVPDVLADVAQQLTDADRLQNGGHVLHRLGLQRASQIQGRVPLASPGLDAVAEDLLRVLAQAVRGDDRPALLNPAQSLQQHRGVDAGQRQRAQHREQVEFAGPQPLPGVRWRPAVNLLGMELARHVLEGARQRLTGGGQGFGLVPALLFGLPCLAGLARVSASRHHRAGLVSPLAGVGQRHLGVRAQPDALLFPADAVLQPPPLPAVRLQFQVQPTTVGQLAGLLAGLRLADGGIAQGVGGGHVGAGFPGCGGRFWTCPHCCPHVGAGSSVPRRGSSGNKKALER